MHNKSILSDRYQAVMLDGVLSGFELVEHGVPQGSVLGPSFFIIYINDLPSQVRDELIYPYLFADDLALSVTDNNVDSLRLRLDGTSITIQDWCSANSLCLNEEKTVQILFTPSRLRPAQADTVKFLGVHLEPGLGWETHVNSLVNKICKGIFMLRILSLRVSVTALLTVYYGHIFSHLSYGVILWGNHPSVSRLLILQKKAVRIMCRARPSEHCKPLFVQLKLLTLPAIYVLDCLLYVKKHIEHFTLCDNLHNYSTRQESNVFIKFNKYSRTLKSYEVTAIKLYNGLPHYIKNLPVNQYKLRLKSFLIANPLYSTKDFLDLNLVHV
uniref:Reverse transcriptase domain-containing protein n=1 Tax=Graphocephala atropunctata TaxID=36148 RepID=A0A1B6M6R6_9HEMI